MTTGTDGRAGIDAVLVRRLIADQFPHWRELPVTPVEVEGHDNRTYRLGTKRTVRLPTAAGYVPAIAKESYWLPRLAPSLPLPIPTILAEGMPGPDFAFPWSVRGWLPGVAADRAPIDDLGEFADELAGFLRALWSRDTRDGPIAGAHCWYRGTPPGHYDDETRRCLRILRDQVDVGRVTRVWDAALATEFTGPPVWFHGDIAPGNLLVADGRLSAVIDFGSAGVGDPACDLAIAWTFLAGASRERFRLAVEQDDEMWARARGWALWKALHILTENRSAGDVEQHRVLADILDDHDRHGAG